MDTEILEQLQKYQLVMTDYYEQRNALQILLIRRINDWLAKHNCSNTELSAALYQCDIDKLLSAVREL